MHININERVLNIMFTGRFSLDLFVGRFCVLLFIERK